MYEIFPTKSNIKAVPPDFKRGRDLAYSLDLEEVGHFGELFVYKDSTYKMTFDGTVDPQRLEDDVLLRFYKAQTLGARSLGSSIIPYLHVDFLTEDPRVRIETTFRDWKQIISQPRAYPINGAEMGIEDFSGYPPVKFALYTRWHPRERHRPMVQMIEGVKSVPITPFMVDWIIAHHRDSRFLEGKVDSVRSASHINEVFSLP